LVEALCGLILAQMFLILLPFRLVAKWIGPVTNQNVPIGCLDTTPIVREIGAAVLRAAARLSWTSVCLPRSIVALWMLRRRSIFSRIYFGVAIQEGELKAHAWVVTELGCVWHEDHGFTVITALDGLLK
jgi:hypothetical protein